MWKEGLMLVTVLVLLALVLITPRLMGEEQGDISAIPKVIVDYEDPDFIIYVRGAFDDYRYSNITIEAKRLDEESDPVTVTEENSYVTKLILQNSSAGIELWIDVWAYDTLFQYNCTITLVEGSDPPTLRIVTLDETGHVVTRTSTIPFKDTIQVSEAR